MTEVLVIVALVAIATIGLVGAFGNNLHRLFGASSDSLAGNTDSASMAYAGPHLTNKNFNTFGMNASEGGPMEHRTGGPSGHGGPGGPGGPAGGPASSMGL